jgi:hypothetical protein
MSDIVFNETASQKKHRLAEKRKNDPQTQQYGINRSREPESWHVDNKISHDDDSVIHETGD